MLLARNSLVFVVNIDADVTSLPYRTAQGRGRGRGGGSGGGGGGVHPNARPGYVCYPRPSWTGPYNAEGRASGFRRRGRHSAKRETSTRE